jgi:hypothetical protein
MSVLDGVSVSSADDAGSFLKLLLNTNNYNQNKIMSEIPPDLVYQMSVINVVMKKFKSPLLKDLSNEIYLHQVAKDRKGRLEAVEISTTSRGPSLEEE